MFGVTGEGCGCASMTLDGQLLSSGLLCCLLSMYSSGHLVEGGQLMWGSICVVEYKGVCCMLVLMFLNDCWLMSKSSMVWFSGPLCRVCGLWSQLGSY